MGQTRVRWVPVSSRETARAPEAIVFGVNPPSCLLGIVPAGTLGYRGQVCGWFKPKEGESKRDLGSPCPLESVEAR